MITKLLPRLAFVLWLAGCERPAGPAPALKPAEKPADESKLARVTLSREAQESLGLKTTPVRITNVQEHRPLTGWIMVRPSDEGSLTAPVGGYLRAPDEPARLPAPGVSVAKGDVLFRLEPVLSPLEQTQLAALRRGIESDLAKAKEQASLADNELKRVAELYKQKLRGERDLEQARIALKVAQEDVDAASDKLGVIMAPGAAKGDFRPAPLTLTAPRSGVVLAVLASPGQFVAAAAPLASIADLSRPLIRVPIPEHDLARVDRTSPAEVAVYPEGARGRQGQPSLLRLEAQPMAPAEAGKEASKVYGVLVPQVDPIKHSADLIYELRPPKEALLVKDQMVSVSVPLGSREPASLVPYAAVLFDAYGGSWIYIDRTARDADSCVYERVRVELGAPFGSDVAVRPALEAGEPVVSEGAATLFSREFYRPPVAAPPVTKR